MHSMMSRLVKNKNMSLSGRGGPWVGFTQFGRLLIWIMSLSEVVEVEEWPPTPGRDLMEGWLQ